ncbi:Bifunctional uridylyltransferase/uridylyl-removing enzyme [Rhodobacteraceae bacterium THAF1]|uniref:[protein-PII] uridylyltransferase n=1 Tax=Palleronia sp. THAF1 TaxID=2587842 RepID=UPI000F3AE1F9|nr:[protein-PII] uridylyltransferase [Palleronia sp. THAF1]QFU07902.1 Bifunctional uridylyltransferase/uridylyl-removing enzyme [Palleronia sp. THAF1]VDC25736.1 Bifunctional uridylyltransferase/uridylyl-removing enzyme [Rhodobacteraceae bacterium THAF1]
MPVSKAQGPDDGHRLPPELIVPAAVLFDAPAIRAAIHAEAGVDDPDALQQALVSHLRAAQDSGRKAIAAAFTDAPLEARATVSAYSWLTDRLVETAFAIVSQHLHPDPFDGTEPLAVFAVGGYGRAEMAPFSDVDLLFLSPRKLTDRAQSVIETMLYVLWDLKMKVGHASRTIPECVRLGREDITIRTALLENRFLCGEETVADDLDTTLWRDLFTGTEAEFITAKLDERSTRHTKQGGQRYVVEPNVKEGKGGLRDLQTLFWIAKYVNHVPDVADLVEKGTYTADEFESFVKAESFLLAVRCHLHLIAGRGQDQLTFDMQVGVAERMGYADGKGRRAVEIFMQDYFRHATRVGELTRILLTALEADHKKREPALVGFFRRRKRARPGYAMKQGRLAFEDPDAALAKPVTLLHIFDEALRTGLLLHPDAMRLIAANLKRIDDEVRRDPEAIRIFYDLLLKHGNPDRALRRMNELGVLAAFLPEFEPIVAMMQFNMYHHYTVDEHTIQCIRTLAEIEAGAHSDDLPLSTDIVKGLPRKVLYTALLLHDIGKGRDEDHAVLGARIARKVCPRLGMSRNDTETVEWLVRYHLLMSDMAQKRDLSDPRTIRDFAKAVRTKKRLDLLTVLTVCDIRGVGPGTWNNWKAQLLRTLHRETAFALENGLEALNRENRGNEAKAALRAALSDWPAKDVRTETARHYPPYWQGLGIASHTAFATLLRGIEDNQIRIDITDDVDRDATRVCFAMVDHPGIFTRLAGALALVGANTVDARTYTSKDGYATAVFWVQDADGHPYDPYRHERLKKMIDQTLKGEVIARDAMESRDKMKKRERDFRVPTSIAFDNEGSEIYTIIEVDTRDRPGLLHDLTRVLAASNISIASAVIATYGAQVVDTFYVKDMFGLKIYTESKQKALEKKLREAIDAGAKRARG